MALTSEWKTAEKSAGNGQCVTVRKGPKFIEVHDSKDKNMNNVQFYTEEEWPAFLDGVKKGEFDLA